MVLCSCSKIVWEHVIPVMGKYYMDAHRLGHNSGETGAEHPLGERSMRERRDGCRHAIRTGQCLLDRPPTGRRLRDDLLLQRPYAPRAQAVGNFAANRPGQPAHAAATGEARLGPARRDSAQCRRMSFTRSTGSPRGSTRLEPPGVVPGAIAALGP